MNPTHIGSLPRGKRVHLTAAKGWSACSRRTLDVSPIEQCRYKWDDPWCGTCLARLADHAASDLTIFGLMGFGREEQDQPTAADWDAKACSDVGAMILSYIEANQAPPGSRYVGDLQDWAQRLVRCGGDA